MEFTLEYHLLKFKHSPKINGLKQCCRNNEYAQQLMHELYEETDACTKNQSEKYTTEMNLDRNKSE